MTKENKAGMVTFSVKGEKGKEAFVAGDFNGWDPYATRMAYKAKKGVYAVTVKLSKGTHQYKFVIDKTWCCDPENPQAVPNELGSFNSLVEVG